MSEYKGHVRGQTREPLHKRECVLGASGWSGAGENLTEGAMPPLHPQFYKRFGGLKQEELAV